MGKDSPHTTACTGPSNSAFASLITSSRTVHGGMCVNSNSPTPAAAARSGLNPNPEAIDDSLRDQVLTAAETNSSAADTLAEASSEPHSARAQAIATHAVDDLPGPHEGLLESAKETFSSASAQAHSQLETVLQSASGIFGSAVNAVSHAASAAVASGMHAAEIAADMVGLGASTDERTGDESEE